MIEQFFNLLAIIIGAISLIGGFIALGIILVGVLAGIYQLGAWVIDGIRD